MKNINRWGKFIFYLYCIPALLGNNSFINAMGTNSSIDAKSCKKSKKCSPKSRKRSRKCPATVEIIPEETVCKESGPELWVTIFIHGIMSIQPHITLQNVMRFVRDDIQNTIYSKAVEYLRLDPYFYLNQAMQEFGLKRVDLTNLQPGNATNAIADIYDSITRSVNPQAENHYYTFGWSGLLSPTARYNDAIKLLEEVTQELQENYWQYNIFPKLRLICYSHGGNVGLNIAAARQNTAPDSPISVDELILVGVPIQTETDYLVADPIFKKIYHFFSQADRIQRIDFFSFNRVFSRRYFRNSNNFKVPKKLMQIDMKFTRSAHTRHNTKARQAACNDFSNPGIISGKSSLLRDCSPGHLEFWFFGWSPKHYREGFIFHPLPAFVTIPYILHYVNQIRDEIVTPQPLIVDIRPEFETMIIKQRKCNNITHVFPFLSHESIAQLNSIADKVALNAAFKDDYENHVQSAVRKSKKYYKVYDERKSRSGSYKRNRRMRKRNLTVQPPEQISVSESAILFP